MHPPPLIRPVYNKFLHAPLPLPFFLCRKRPHFNPTSKKEDSHEPRGVRGEFGRETEAGRERAEKRVYLRFPLSPTLLFTCSSRHQAHQVVCTRSSLWEKRRETCARKEDFPSLFLTDRYARNSEEGEGHKGEENILSDSIPAEGGEGRTKTLIAS